MKYIISALIGIVSLSSCSKDESTIQENSNLNFSSDEKIKTYDFDFNTGNDYGFKGLFLDVPARIYNNYQKLVKEGKDLGPVPPTIEDDKGRWLSSNEEDSHWFMNAGIFEVADNPGIKGFLLQGVNRSDDMDKYMVREFNKEDNIKPNTTYKVVINSATSAGNDRVGALGPGGAEVRSFNAYVSSLNPNEVEFDEINHARFKNKQTETGKPWKRAQRIDVGTTGVCTLHNGAFKPLPGDVICPNEGRVKFKVRSHFIRKQAVLVTSDSQGRFWLSVGGHSGHESLDDYYVIKLNLTIEQQD